MTGCSAEDEAWQVRVCKPNGESVGAGVLLGVDRLLTCAHVVEEASEQDGTVRVDSVLCRPRWSASATALPGGWAYKPGTAHSTPRGDVAVLRLIPRVTCHTGTRLRKAPVRDVGVRMHGFPDRDRVGSIAEGRLTGLANDGEWVELHKPAGYGGQWVTAGFSGAGVVERATGAVIGILVARRETTTAANAWMMPTAVIAEYLPAVRPFVEGVDASDGTFGWSLDTPGEPQSVPELELRAQVRCLFGRAWSGTAVITGAVGMAWLTRLVASADPAVRPRMADEPTIPDAALGMGAIDLSINARDRTAGEIRELIARRFALPVDTVIDGLLRRSPPPTLVITQVDSAQDPRQLVGELLAPLAERARRYGVRLVLTFAGQPSADLPHELSLGAEPVTGAAVAPLASAGAVTRRLARLAETEEKLLDLYAEVSRLAAGAPRPGPCLAPRLRVRATVAAAAERAAIYDQAGIALMEAERLTAELDRLRDKHADLGHLLELYWNRAAACAGAEDPELGELYSAALHLLRTGPCNLAAAQLAVDTYAAAIRRRGKA